VTGDVGGEGVGSRHWMRSREAGGSGLLVGLGKYPEAVARFWEVVTFWLKMVPLSWAGESG